MNAVTHQEAQALHAVIPAPPSQNMLLVPLSQLRPSRRNVRKTAGQASEALSSGIGRVGLLQNLTVILAADGEHIMRLAKLEGLGAHAASVAVRLGR